MTRREMFEVESAHEACNIATGRHENFEQIEEEIVDSGRWDVVYEVVVRRKSDGKYFASCFTKGATEMQDQSPYEYDERKFWEVVPKTKTITVYE